MRLWNFIKDPSHSGAVIAILTLVIAGSNIGYDIVASCQLTSMNKQLSEMQKQTTLSRQQLVGTQAAVLQIDIHEPDSATSGLVGGIRNAGIVNATDVYIRVQITRQRFANGAIAPIGQPLVYEDKPKIIKGGNGTWPDLFYPHIWPVPWIRGISQIHPPLKSWPANWPGNDITEIQVSLSYNNGFNDSVKQDICYEMTPHFRVEIANGVMSLGGMFPCESFTSEIADARKTWEAAR